MDPRVLKRKTRFVCVSDTHSASPTDGAFKLPAGDVLIHAGDLTNQGSYSELKKTVQWIEDADFQCKIVIAGNHDITLDEGFNSEHGHQFHSQNLQDPAEYNALLTNAPSITYLNHSSASIKLREGPRTTFKVFGSPHIPVRGLWAFGYEQDEAAALWQEIPTDTDILVTHTPPKGHCDKSPKWGDAGCEDLRKVLWRVRPGLAVCGHVHEARGAERIQWSGSPTEELGCEAWTDPGIGNKKQSLLDLTARSGTALKVGGETCVVNAAIMARSWPGPKRYNKPIVVDLELPVWSSSDAE